MANQLNRFDDTHAMYKFKIPGIFFYLNAKNLLNKFEDEAYKKNWNLVL